MKGLLLKDLYVLRRSVLFYLVFIVACTVGQGTNGAIFSMFYGCVIAVSLISLDERDRFDRLLPTTPVSGVALVLDKYVTAWAVILAALGMVGVCHLVSGAPVDLLVLLIGVSITLVFQAILMPLIFRLGVERGRVVYLIAIILLAASLAALGNLWETMLASMSTAAFVLTLLGASAGLNALSIFLSSRLFIERCTR